MYNNVIACEEWSGASAKLPTSKEPVTPTEDPNQKFLALLMSDVQDITKQASNNGGENNRSQGRYNSNWKATNKNGAKTCARKNAKGIDRDWY